MDNLDLDIPGLMELDAETRTYLGTIGLDCKGSGLPVPAETPGPGTHPRRSRTVDVGSPGVVGKPRRPRPFLSVLVRAVKFIGLGLGVLVLVVVALSLLWFLLVVAWFLLVKVVLPVLACLLFLLIVVCSIKGA